MNYPQTFLVQSGPMTKLVTYNSKEELLKDFRAIKEKMGLPVFLNQVGPTLRVWEQLGFVQTDPKPEQLRTDALGNIGIGIVESE